MIARYSGPGVNLRTHLQRILRKAGVDPWPRLWHNLRASRATELCEQFPEHVCNSWFGHTEKVAEAHYRQVLDRHFAKAAGVQCPPACPSETPATSRRESQRKGEPLESLHSFAGSTHGDAFEYPRQESNL